MSVRWGSPGMNEWNTFRVNNEIIHEAFPVSFIKEAAPSNFYDMIMLDSMSEG
jgi:hypothetical protein